MRVDDNAQAKPVLILNDYRYGAPSYSPDGHLFACIGPRPDTEEYEPDMILIFNAKTMKEIAEKKSPEKTMYCGPITWFSNNRFTAGVHYEEGSQDDVLIFEVR